LTVAQVLNPAVPSHFLAPVVHSLVQDGEQVPLEQVWPLGQLTAIPHFKHPSTNAQACTLLPLHCVALAVVQVEVQLETQVPLLQVWPAAHLDLSSNQSDPAKLQTLHPETAFGVQTKELGIVGISSSGAMPV
jgi:hypothetical protein